MEVGHKLKIMGRESERVQVLVQVQVLSLYTAALEYWGFGVLGGAKL